MFQKCSRQFTLKLVVSLLLLQPAFAEDSPEALNPIDCLTAIEPLSIGFRSHLQSQCIALPIENCNLNQNPTQCFSLLNQSLTGYFTELRAEMPESIPGTGFGPSSYRRAIIRLDESFADFSECDVLADTEAQVCQSLHLSVAVIGLLYRARQAEIITPQSSSTD
jgi:hypothetical protein